MNSNKTTLQFEDEIVSDHKITKDYPTLADLMREQGISNQGANSVHYRRDLDSLG